MRATAPETSPWVESVSSTIIYFVLDWLFPLHRECSFRRSCVFAEEKLSSVVYKQHGCHSTSIASILCRHGRPDDTEIILLLGVFVFYYLPSYPFLVVSICNIFPMIVNYWLPLLSNSHWEIYELSRTTIILDDWDRVQSG